MFAFFWATRSLFHRLPAWTAYLLPPFVLTSGVLGWSLWSGMELALFFGVWGVLAHYYVAHRSAASERETQLALRAMAFWSLLLVLTRPEALWCSGLFALFASMSPRCREGTRWQTLGKLLLPATTFTLLRGLLNWYMTGSFADAGAIVKLHTLRPFLEPREIALKWLQNVGFQFSRISVYHTTDDAVWGWGLWVLVALAFVPKRTRGIVCLLSLHAVGWILLVAQNEYVRYQNDRYTMPAVLWLLVAAALGLGSWLVRAHEAFGRRDSTVWIRRTIGAGGATIVTGVFLLHQFPRLNQQRWLFGRASRNIAEQQVRTGQLFAAGHFGSSHRVLVGDAGAIPYFSRRPGVDAIGLGGTRGLPFAKAVNLGVGATVELIERMRPEERPDRMALYPSWWDLLPVWFGRSLGEIRIKGNVICGAANKVVYEADWHSLEQHSRPLEMPAGARILDELDFADVVSEAEHGYALSSKHSGYVVMKVLPHPLEGDRGLFDAGRLVFFGASTRFFLSGFRTGQPASLVFRAAPNYSMTFRVRVDGRDAGRVEFDGGSGWQQARLSLDPKRLRKSISVELVAETAEHILYHLWAVDD
jgi:hypothetical protein